MVDAESMHQSSARQYSRTGSVHSRSTQIGAVAASEVLELQGGEKVNIPATKTSFQRKQSRLVKRALNSWSGTNSPHCEKQAHSYQIINQLPR